MAKVKKIPKRMCVGCRVMKPRRELIRVILTPESEGCIVCIDFKGKQNGRGAYICRDNECLNKAKKIRALERALSREIPEAVYNQLSEQMKTGGEPI